MLPVAHEMLSEAFNIASFLKSCRPGQSDDEGHLGRLQGYASLVKFFRQRPSEMPSLSLFDFICITVEIAQILKFHNRELQ